MASTSFCKSLFHGEILENIVFPFPQMPRAEAENVRAVLDTLAKFRETVDSVKMDEAGSFPEGFLARVGELGLLGLTVPEQYGGLGLSVSGYARAMEEVAGIDGSLAVVLGGHQGLGFKSLTMFGTKEQKQRYYPRLATGELLACFALTEPGAGSDAGSLKTKATLSADGKHFLVTGQKILITNAGLATFITVFAKTDEPGGREKVTAFILEIPKDPAEQRALGVHFGPPEDKMGIRASVTAGIYFENVKIPVENVLGERGKGFKIAMEILNHGREGVAGGALGGSKFLVNMALKQAVERKQFGKRIGDFGMIQEKVGQMVVDTFVAESLVIMSAALIDNNEHDYSLETSIAKVFATESLWRTVNDTMQIFGGMGYMRECGIERMLRDARIALVYEGTSEILRLFIALAGLQGPGEELADVAKAIKDPLKQIGVLSGFAAKTLKLNVLGAATLTKAHPRLKKQAGMLEEYVGEFALQCQKLLQRHGKAIADRQFACRRVADITIDLYAMTCLLSRVTSMIEMKGADNCEQELAIASSFCLKANRRVRGNFKAIDRNDDDETKLIANRHYELGRYQWDAV